MLSTLLNKKFVVTFYPWFAADGVEERHSVNHESDDDADGQATDPSRTKPKVRIV